MSCFGLGAMLILACTVIQTRIYQEHLHYDQMTYGMWDDMLVHAENSDFDMLQSDDQVLKAGKITIGSSYFLPSRTIISGSYDVQAQELANLQLFKGTLPTEPGQAAIEMDVLSEMGRPYEVNQTITLEDEKGEETFYITGILENYTQDWMYGNHLPNLILSESVDEKDQLILIQTANGQKSKLKDLTFEGNGFILENSLAELSFDLFSQDNLLYTALMIVVFAADIIGILCFFLLWLKKHRQEIILLKQMGIADSKLNFDLIRLICFCSIFPYTALLACSFLLHVERILILCSSLIYWISVLFCELLIGIVVHNIPCEFVSHNVQSKTIKPCKPFRAPITPHKLAIRFLRIHFKTYAIQSVCLALFASATFGALVQYRFNADLEQYAGISYDFHLYSDVMNQDLDTSFDANAIAEIQNLPDIKKKNLYWNRLNCTISWQDHGQSQLRRLDINEYGMFHGNLIGTPTIRGNEVLLDGINGYSIDQMDNREHILGSVETSENNTENNDFDLKAFEQGQSVILFLPVIYESSKQQENTDPNQLKYVFERFENPQSEFSKADSGYTQFEETSLHTGDSVTICMGSQSKMVKVGGIIRQLPEELSVNFPADLLQQPYTFIASDSFFHEGAKVLNHVQLWLDDRQNQDQIETLVNALQVSNHMMMDNNSHENRRALEFFEGEKQRFLMMTLLFFGLFVGTMIYLSQKQSREERHFLQSLEAVAIKEKKLIQIQSQLELCRAGMFVLCLVVMSGLLMIGLNYFIPNLNEILSFAPNFFNYTTGKPEGILRMINANFKQIGLVLLPLEILMIWSVQKIFNKLENKK